MVLYSAVAVWALARNATNRPLLGEVGAVERLLSLLEMMQEEEKVREVSTPPGIATTTAINYVKSFAFQHLVLHFNASSPTPIPLSFLFFLSSHHDHVHQIIIDARAQHAYLGFGIGSPKGSSSVGFGSKNATKHTTQDETGDRDSGPEPLWRPGTAEVPHTDDPSPNATPGASPEMTMDSILASPGGEGGRGRTLEGRDNERGGRGRSPLRSRSPGGSKIKWGSKNIKRVSGRAR